MSAKIDLSGDSTKLQENFGNKPPVKDEGLHAQCQKWKGNILRNDNVVKFMLFNMKKIGCPLNGKSFICSPCEKQVGGHFSPDSGIVLCENRLSTEKQMAETMIHESIHAFDHCRANVDWNNCHHHACSEIRAASLSGDCDILNEFSRGNLFRGIKKRHQDCVRRRAILSILMNPSCKGRAERVVDEVFETCFRDTEPFDEIY